MTPAEYGSGSSTTTVGQPETPCSHSAKKGTNSPSRCCATQTARSRGRRSRSSAASTQTPPVELAIARSSASGLGRGSTVTVPEAGEPGNGASAGALGDGDGVGGAAAAGGRAPERVEEMIGTLAISSTRSAARSSPAGMRSTTPGPLSSGDGGQPFGRTAITGAERLVVAASSRARRP